MSSNYIATVHIATIFVLCIVYVYSYGCRIVEGKLHNNVKGHWFYRDVIRHLLRLIYPKALSPYMEHRFYCIISFLINFFII